MCARCERKKVTKFQRESFLRKNIIAKNFEGGRAPLPPGLLRVKTNLRDEISTLSIQLCDDEVRVLHNPNGMDWRLGFVLVEV